MPTTAPTLERPMPAAVHQPAAIELWLNAQPAEPKPYRGRHRGRAAVEAEPLNVHAISAEAPY